jgi:cell wall assembly regulator SMI1
VIELVKPRPPVPADELAAAEHRLAELGHRIPPSYKAFLTEHDGGEPVRNRFTYEGDGELQKGTVQVFIGVAPSPDGDLVSKAKVMADRLPPGVIVIADDPGGNHVCLDARDGRDGPVLFWDHEYEGDPPDEANLYEIAPDLETFLDGLTEPPALPEEPVVLSTAKGWRKLFSRR